MGAVRKAGVGLIALGVLLLIVGFILSASPETVERTVTVPHEDVLVDRRVEIGPGEYLRVRFSVPPEARTAYLDVSVIVYSGNDVKLILYHGTTKVFERKVIGSYSDTITLDGSGSYELRVDNSWSIITSKDVHVRAVLHWSEYKVERQEIQEKGWNFIGASIFFVIVGSILYFVGGRAEPRPESVSLVLVDLAKRKPPEESGIPAEAEIILEMKGLDRSDAEQLFRVVAESRGVSVHRKYSWLMSQYRVRIRGDKNRVVEASKDIVEFCERTKKCKAKIEKPF